MKIEFFDCNVRLGRANNPNDSKIHTAVEITAHMKYCGIKGALVFHNQALSDWRGGNERLAAEISGISNLHGCAVVVPSCTGEYEADTYFKELANADFKAIRMFPRLNNFSLKPYSVEETFKGALKYHFPVILDFIDYNDSMLPYSTWDFSPDYDAIFELAHAFPQNRFIIVLPGMQTQRKQYALLAKTDNVYLECSSFGFGTIEHICNNFGSEKLVFGTYTPILEPGAFMTYINYADIPIEDKIAIAGRNVERLLGIAHE